MSWWDYLRLSELELVQMRFVHCKMMYESEKKREKCWKKGWSHDDVSCMVVGQYVLSNGQMGCHMSPCVAVSFLQIIGTLLVFTSTKNNVPHAGMEVKSVIEQSMARRSMDDHNSNDGCWLFKNLLFKFFSGFCFECVQTCFVT